MSAPAALTRTALSGWAEASAPARRAGLMLGAQDDGRPVQAQVFRRAGTRIVCAAGLTTAQLLSVRAAAVGIPVLVRSENRDRWRAPQAAFGQRILVDSRPAPELPSRMDQPVLYVDDLPNDPGSGEARPWQCRLLVRDTRSAAELHAHASADLLLLGRLGSDVAAAVASGFGLGATAGPALSGLPRGRVALIRARRLSTLSLAPTPDERRVLGQ